MPRPAAGLLLPAQPNGSGGSSGGSLRPRRITFSLTCVPSSHHCFLAGQWWVAPSLAARLAAGPLLPARPLGCGGSSSVPQPLSRFGPLLPPLLLAWTVGTAPSYAARHRPPALLPAQPNGGGSPSSVDPSPRTSPGSSSTKLSAAVTPRALRSNLDGFWLPLVTVRCSRFKISRVISTALDLFSCTHLKLSDLLP